MEGLIPFVYKAIMQYKNGEQGPMSWLNESPSASYMRLPTGDSGRFQVSDIQLFLPEYGFSSNTAMSSSTKRKMVTGGGAVQSPVAAGSHLINSRTPTVK